MMLFFGAIITGTWSLVCDGSISYIWSRWISTRWERSDFCWFWIPGRHGFWLHCVLCPYCHIPSTIHMGLTPLELCRIHAQTKSLAESLAHYFGYQLRWTQWFITIHHTLNLIFLGAIVVIISNWGGNCDKSPHYFIYLCKISVQCKINAPCQQVHKADLFLRRMRT